MIKKIVLYIIIVFCYANIYGQKEILDTNMSDVNPFFRKMIYKSIKKINKKNREYENDNLIQYKPVYIVNIKSLSLDKKESAYAVFQYLTKSDYDSLDATGYISFDDYTILIYSDNYKDMLQNIIKIPKINNDVNDEIAFKYPSDLISGEIVTYLVKYKNHRYKIRKQIY